MTTRKRRIKKQSSGTTISFNRVDHLLSKAQLVLLLAAIVLVPLVVLPNSNFVDITSTPKATFLRMLGTLQLGVLLSRLLLHVGSTGESPFSSSLASIRSSKPVLAITGSIAVVTIVSILSAILSIMPAQSWWGRVPAAFESGEFTALMYVIMSISTLISVREFGRSNIFWSTLATTGVLAGLVGLFQFVGWAPLDISSTHRTRITGTNGNPIFFGAMLVVLAPITLAVIANRVQTSSITNKYWWYGALGSASFLLSLSLIATVSRGPWVGAFTGGIVAVATMFLLKRMIWNPRIIAVMAASFVAAALITTFVDPTPPLPNADAPSESSASSSAVTSAYGHVGRTSTLDLRLKYWKLSADMAINRDPVPFTREMPKVVRLLFGYGPDSFRFAGSYFANDATFTRRLTAAHSDPINRLAEQGVLGFIAWMTLWLSIAYGVITLIRRGLSHNETFLQWIAIGIAVAMTARFVEQLFGSPTPGGVLIFWVLTGGLAALLMLPTESDKSKRASQLSPRFPQYFAYTGVIIILLGSVTIGWDRGANYLIANQIASFQYRSTVVPYADANSRLEKAAKAAPDVPLYWHDLAELEHGRAASTTDPQAKAEALAKAYEYDLKAYEANPMEVSSIYSLAYSAWESGILGQPELRFEAVRLYERLTQIMPSDQLAHERLKILQDYLAQQ